MNIISWAVLFGTAFSLSLLAFVAKRAPVYTSLASIIAWLVVAYGSTNLVWPSNGTEFTFQEDAVAIFAFFHVLLSGVVFLAAVIGDYGAKENATDGLEGTDLPNAGHTPWSDNQ